MRQNLTSSIPNLTTFMMIEFMKFDSLDIVWSDVKLLAIFFLSNVASFCIILLRIEIWEILWMPIHYLEAPIGIYIGYTDHIATVIFTFRINFQFIEPQNSYNTFGLQSKWNGENEINWREKEQASKQDIMQHVEVSSIQWVMSLCYIYSYFQYINK